MVFFSFFPRQLLMDKRVGLKRYELSGRKVLFYFDEVSRVQKPLCPTGGALHAWVKVCPSHWRHVFSQSVGEQQIKKKGGWGIHKLECLSEMLFPGCFR